MWAIWILVGIAAWQILTLVFFALCDGDEEKTFYFSVFLAYLAVMGIYAIFSQQMRTRISRFWLGRAEIFETENPDPSKRWKLRRQRFGKICQWYFMEETEAEAIVSQILAKKRTIAGYFTKRMRMGVRTSWDKWLGV